MKYWHLIQHKKTLLFVLLHIKSKVFKRTIFKWSFWSYSSHQLFQLLKLTNRWGTSLIDSNWLNIGTHTWQVGLFRSEFPRFWDIFAWFISCCMVTSKIVDCALDIFVGYVCGAVIFFDAFLEEDRVGKAASIYIYNWKN